MRTQQIVIGSLLFIVCLAAAPMMAGGTLATLINPIALVMVLFMTLGVGIMGYGVTKPWKQSLKALRGEVLSTEESQELQGYFTLITQAACFSGLIGAIIGMVQMLSNLSDPSKIGPGMAIAFLSILYGGAIGAMAYGAAHSLRAPPATKEPEEANAPTSDESTPAQPEEDSGHMLSTLAGVIIVFCSFAFPTIMAGGTLHSYISPESFVLVAGTIVGICIMSFGLMTPLKQLKALLTGHETETKALEGSLGLITQVGPLSGLIGAIVGLVHTMENLSDPSKLGAGIALAFISLVYGTFIALLAYGFKALVQKTQMRRTGSSDDSLVGNAVHFVMSAFFILIGSFFIVMYSISLLDS